ncbi:MFS transporter [Dermatophilaceae bacterium Sec6.4]
MPDNVDQESTAPEPDSAHGAGLKSGGPGTSWASRGVFGVGAASLFSDSGHEMVTAVLPTFITSTLHAGPAALGAIDGVADALTGLSKLAGGPLANDRTRRIKLASSGYLGTAIATAAIGLAMTVWQVAILRALAWVSRGIRSPARDMMLTDLAREEGYGRAFGLERAGDNAGAIVGPLLAAGLVTVLGLRHTILLAFIPGALAAVAITIAGREARRTVADPTARETLSFNLRELRRAGLGQVLTPVALFEFGNLATTLLILRATDLLHTDARSLTAATSLAILLYAAHNAAATVASLGGGQLADRINPRVVFAAGAATYVLSYLLFAVDEHAWPLVLLAFLLSGVGIGLAETAESTVVARGLPARLRANGFGVLGLTQSLGDLVATVVVGVLWSLVSPTVAFCYAAAWMLASLAASGLLHPRAPATK